jgi:hypothetical protein
MLLRRLARPPREAAHAARHLSALPPSPACDARPRPYTVHRTRDTAASPPAALSLKQRLTDVMRVYGLTATIFHSTVYVCSLGSAFAAIQGGMDTAALLSGWGLDATRLTSIPPEAGDLAAAWVVTAVTGPARGVITITGTPIIGQWLKKRRRKAAS